ncbi:MAG: nuclear transport factor 2 family protein [candidate division WOR-3 bacterium]|nr:MAG: nuclear transport factor 2 family protein [candidate division WOR-3 bacterium]
MIHNLNNTPLFSLLVLLMFIFLSCAPKLDERVKAYEQAYNSHDVEKIMSFYADDIKFEVVGFFVKEGTEEVRNLTEYDVTVNIQMSISNIKVNGDTATFTLIESNDWFRLAGVEELVYEPNRIVFRDGLIKEIRAEITPESVKAAGKAYQTIMQWASKEHSEALAELTPGGIFSYTAETAKKWLELLKEWRNK